MVIQDFGRLILTSNINNNIRFLPYSWIPRSDNLSLMKLFSEVPEHDTCKNLITVKIAIMSADSFHVGTKSKELFNNHKLST